MQIIDLKLLLILTAVLILITQVIVEVIKMAFAKNSSKYNVITIITAIVITIVSFIAICCYKGFSPPWYYIFVAVIYGVFIGYGAMVGYDKLIKRIFDIIRTAKNNYNQNIFEKVQEDKTDEV